MRAAIFSMMVFLINSVGASEDAVMSAGETIAIKNKIGEIVVKAEPNLRRTYVWHGQARSVTMLERSEAWLGSKSIYYPGSGEHWLDNNGVTRGVLEEGKRKFKDSLEFRNWIKHSYQSYLDFKYLGSGRIGGWALVKERKQMNCVLWKIWINGELLSESIFQTAILDK